MKNTSIVRARIFSAFILLLTIIVFASDILPTESVLLETITILIMAHLVLTFVFFFVAYRCRGMLIQSLKMIGTAYILIGGIGFIGLSLQINVEGPHIIFLNLLSYFQFGLGVAICVSGSIIKNSKSEIVV